MKNGKHIVSQNRLTEFPLYTTPTGHVKVEGYINIQLVPFWN